MLCTRLLPRVQACNVPGGRSKHSKSIAVCLVVMLKVRNVSERSIIITVVFSVSGCFDGMIEWKAILKQGNQRWQIARPATCQCLATL